MSEIFEGAIVPAINGGPPALSGIAMRLAASSLGPDAFVLYRTDLRRDAAFTREIDGLAEHLSNVTGRALVLRYDSRLGHRSSRLYIDGRQIRAFGEDDELFVPLDDDGEPVLSARPVRRDEFEAGAEYETVRNAIQLGMDALGVGDWKALVGVMTQ